MNEGTSRGGLRLFKRNDGGFTSNACEPAISGATNCSYNCEYHCLLRPARERETLSGSEESLSTKGRHQEEEEESKDARGFSVRFNVTQD